MNTSKVQSNRFRVKFYRDSYAPCMTQAIPMNRNILKLVMEHLSQFGQDDENTALLSNEDCEFYLNNRQLKELDHWNQVTVLLDGFTLGNLYGYDTQDLFRD